MKDHACSLSPSPLSLKADLVRVRNHGQWVAGGVEMKWGGREGPAALLSLQGLSQQQAWLGKEEKSEPEIKFTVVIII